MTITEVQVVKIQYFIVCIGTKPCIFQSFVKYPKYLLLKYDYYLQNQPFSYSKMGFFSPDWDTVFTENQVPSSFCQ